MFKASRIKWLPFFSLSAMALVMLLLAVLMTRSGGALDTTTPAAKTATPPTNAKPHVITINRPDGPPRVATDEVDAMGRPVTVSCASCHATREPALTARGGNALDEFHQGMQYAHADVTCLTCHNANDYNTLRRADGSSILYQDVMQLCAQCHGPQTRDYQNGSHGGMTGYWDRTRGPRQRNNCIDCHDPHTPGYPVMKPVFKPNDRFMPADVASHAKKSEGAHD